MNEEQFKAYLATLEDKGLAAYLWFRLGDMTVDINDEAIQYVTSQYQPMPKPESEPT